MDHPRRTYALPETLIALGTLAFAGLLLWQASEIPVSPLYAKIGPSLFPYFGAAALAALALMLLVQALRGGWQPDEEKELKADWRALAFVTAGLIANVALITHLGFTLASTVLFVLVAYGFGSRRPLRDATIGFVVALVAYFGFAKVLGVNIGAGFLERMLGG